MSKHKQGISSFRSISMGYEKKWIDRYAFPSTPFSLSARFYLVYVCVCVYLFPKFIYMIFIWFLFFLIAFLCHCEMRCVPFLFLFLLICIIWIHSVLKFMLILFSPYLYHLNVHVVLIVCIVCRCVRMCFYSISFLPIVRLSVTIVDEFMYQLRSMLHSFSSLFLQNISIVFSIYLLLLLIIPFQCSFLCACIHCMCEYVSFFQVLSLLHSFLLSTQKKNNKVQCKDWCQK